MEYIVLLIVPMFLAMWAQMKVSGAYKKYSEVGSRSGISGKEAAQYMLRRFGINDVTIKPIGGVLTDHYNPTTKELALSEKNFYGKSLAAIGVAAHEAGHAIQHAVGYKALNLRMALVPITGFASRLSFIAIILGLWLAIAEFAYLGVGVFLILTLFQLVTLPVEFDASNRAKAEIVNLGILQNDEMVGVNKTLDAAAWTYVAAFITSLGYFLYFLLRVLGSRD